jgi:hypothetical protein
MKCILNDSNHIFIYLFFFFNKLINFIFRINFKKLDQDMKFIQKEYSKKFSSIIDDIKIPSLEKLLSTHYTNTVNVTKFSNLLVCDVCNNYSCTTIKQMSCHKRGCSKKIVVQTETKK